MKLKNLARTFLKVGKIINIILIPLFVVLFIVFVIIDGVNMSKAMADNADLNGPASALIGDIVRYILLTVFSVAALILNIRASVILERATSRAEARPGAIMAIIAGALITTFPIVSGILMLVMKEEDWTDGMIENEKPEDF